MNKLLDRISIDPQICGGKPCIRGTRMWVSLILDLLADGVPEEELLEDYPYLTQEDVQAAIAYGAEVSRENIMPAPTARAEVKLKVSAIKTAAEFFERRAEGGDLEDLKRFLRAVPDAPPMPGDELP